MNMFTWLFIGHLVGDFILQTGWMAKKTSNFPALIVHCTVYTLSVFALSLPAGGLDYKAVMLIFISHLILDQRRLVELWVKVVNNASGLPWIRIVVDQCFHFVVLAFTAQYLTK